MKVGDLIKIYPKDGAVSCVVGIYLGDEREPYQTDTKFWIKSPVFLVNGQRKTYNKLDYRFEIIKKD